MANTIAVDQTHRTTPKHAHIGLVRISVVSTDTYSAAGGGFTVDLASTLSGLGIAIADVVAITGSPTLTGHMPNVPAQPPLSSAGVATIRLWNGTAQIADGALTQTVIFNVWFNQGATS